MISGFRLFKVNFFGAVRCGYWTHQSSDMIFKYTTEKSEQYYSLNREPVNPKNWRFNSRRKSYSRQQAYSNEKVDRSILSEPELEELIELAMGDDYYKELNEKVQSAKLEEWDVQVQLL